MSFLKDRANVCKTCTAIVIGGIGLTDSFVFTLGHCVNF